MIDPVIGTAVRGGFDADGDGWTDVAIGGEYEAFTIVYGPFEGVIPAYEGAPGYDPSRITTTERGESCLYDGLTVLGEVNRKGEFVSVAGSMSMPWCGGSLWAYDVVGPPGRHLRFEDAFAEFSAGVNWLEPLPDVNGDGLTDVLYLWQPYTAPIEGYHYGATGHDGQGTEPVVLGFHEQKGAHAIEDVTGDGLGDLLVSAATGELLDLPDSDRTRSVEPWYVVPGTTRGVDLDPAEVGVQLAPIPPVNPWDPEALAYAPQYDSGDLDGDGLAEIVAWQTGDKDRPGPSGWVWIYLGRDLRDAFAAKGASGTATEAP